MTYTIITAPPAPTSMEHPDIWAYPTAAFLLNRGFRLEQVTTASTLDVPRQPDRAQTLLNRAMTVAGPQYRLHSWTKAVPSQYHSGLAALWTAMSVDEPRGGLEIHESQWTERRVAERLDEAARSHQQIIMTAAEHLPSGELAAFSFVTVPMFDIEFAFQQDTLVIGAHRGRRLGMAVKAANLLSLMRERPAIRRIHTYNAQENQYMLAINADIGYRPAGVTAAWQKRL